MGLTTRTSVSVLRRAAVVSCAAGLVAAGISAPTASASVPAFFSSPAEGATISGTEALISVEMDLEALFCTVLKVDGKSLTSAQAVEEGFQVDTTKLSDGTHTFTLDSSQCYGEASGSSTRRFVVRNVVPSVRITAPTPGSAVSGKDVRIVAEATADPQGSQHITHVEFFIDDELLVRDDLAPYDADLDATRLTNGPHTLRAVATDSVGLVGRSEDADVTVGNYRSSIAASASRQQVAAGRPVTITGVVSRVEDGGPLVGAPATLHVRRADQTGWAKVAVAVSGASGQVSASASPLYSSLYQWRYAGGAGSGAAVSSQVRVNVTPGMTLQLATSARRGTTLSANLLLTPATGGQPVVLQRRASGGAWQTLSSGVSKPGVTPVKVAFPRAGTFDVRVQRTANATGTAAESNTVRVQVR